MLNEINVEHIGTVVYRVTTVGHWLVGLLCEILRVYVISVFMFRFAKFPLVCCPAPPPDLKLMVGVLVLEYHLGILYIYLYICMVFAGWSCTALNIYVGPNGGGSLVCARPTQPYQI